jgi:hypothetical protein
MSLRLGSGRAARIVARLCIAATIGPVPVMLAGTTANASGSSCSAGNTWLGSDSSPTKLCTFVKGSGLTVPGTRQTDRTRRRAASRCFFAA